MARQTFEQFESSFWSRVDRRGMGDCWPWGSYCDRDGYGICVIMGHLLGRESRLRTRAHRVAFWLAYGRWPDPWGLHGCDNPPCCNVFNVEHVHEGTASMNAVEAFDRGRRVSPLAGRCGEENSSAYLSDVQACQVRRLVASGVQQKDVAESLRVSRDVIFSIVHGHTYRTDAAGWFGAESR
jgi:hypothetical protein